MSAKPMSVIDQTPVAELADAFIPAAAGRLSASQTGVAEELLAQAVVYDPDLPGRLRRVIGGRPPCDALELLRQTDPAACGSFYEIVAAIYFVSAEVAPPSAFAAASPSRHASILRN